MGKITAIQWCHHTFNPWWGCSRVSPACVRCYADTFAKRAGHGDLWRKHGDRRFFGEKHWAEPLAWDRDAAAAGERRRVFCASMSDVFELHPEFEVANRMADARHRLWDLIAATPNLDWLLLTKRPEHVLSLAMVWRDGWPSNVWIGTSVENQEWADRRIPVLLEIPATVRFLSCEPLLGPLDLNSYLNPSAAPGHCISIDGDWWHAPGTCRGAIVNCDGRCCHRLVDWVIGGGESGGTVARRLVKHVDGSWIPNDRGLEWARSLRDQCVAAGVPFLWKQWGGPTSKSGGRELDGRTWDEVPVPMLQEASV